MEEMTRPLLSVIFANKNRNALLGNSLAYWRRQRGMNTGDIELVVADDGSSLLPTKECEDYGAHLVMVPPDLARRNPSVAWNKGLAVAQGLVKACTHAEVVPSLDAARYLYGVCMADRKALNGMLIWAPDINSEWDVKMVERPIKTSDLPRLRIWAVRANMTTFRLQPEHNGFVRGIGDPAKLEGLPNFWGATSEFGAHTNEEIKNRFRGFFWNNLFAMRAEVWEWINFNRPSRDWGMDDEDSQRRNQILQLAYVFTDDCYGYHQHHGPEFRGPSDDHRDYVTLADARLLDMCPNTADNKLALKRGMFWG